MALVDGEGGKRPYGQVAVLVGLTFGDLDYGPYIRGRLAQLPDRYALQADLSTWLDVVYALWLDAPHEVVQKAGEALRKKSDRIAPDRSTWGLLPEHRAQMGKFEQVLQGD